MEGEKIMPTNPDKPKKTAAEISAEYAAKYLSPAAREALKKTQGAEARKSLENAIKLQFEKIKINTLESLKADIQNIQKMLVGETGMGVSEQNIPTIRKMITEAWQKINLAKIDQTVEFTDEDFESISNYLDSAEQYLNDIQNL